MEEGQAPAETHDAALSIVGSWIEKEAPDPKAEQPEEKPAAAPEEAKPEEAPDPETPAEAQAETRRFKLKYKGEELEKEEPEVIELAQKGWDYTQKSQALAKEREELHSSIQKQVEPKLKEYDEKLQTYERAVWQALAPEVNGTDWNALARDNPAEWAQKMQQVTNVNNVLQAVQRERQQLAAQAQEAAQKQMQKQIREAQEILQNEIPSWSNDLYSKILKNGEEYGYKAEELSQIADPRAIKVLHDAMQYRALKKAKPQVEKKVVDVPKVVKPGTGQRPGDPKAEKWNEAMSRLKKSGKDDDAIRVAKMLLG